MEGTDSDIVKDQFLYLYGEWGSAHIFFLVMVLVGRARRAGVFDFGMGRVLYLQKNLGTGTVGMGSRKILKAKSTYGSVSAGREK